MRHRRVNGTHSNKMPRPRPKIGMGSRQDSVGKKRNGMDIFKYRTHTWCWDTSNVDSRAVNYTCTSTAVEDSHNRKRTSHMAPTMRKSHWTCRTGQLGTLTERHKDPMAASHEQPVATRCHRNTAPFRTSLPACKHSERRLVGPGK